jgi:hypothetical protein
MEMSCFLNLGGFKVVKDRADLVWLEWQEADRGVGENLLSELSFEERERVEREWLALLEKIGEMVRSHLEGK